MAGTLGTAAGVKPPPLAFLYKVDTPSQLKLSRAPAQP